MRVRRALTVTGAVASLVLLGGPAWADETPGPDPAGNPDCFLVPATGEPSAEPTDVATDEPTADPTDVATDEPTDQPTDVATDEPTTDPTVDPTDQPTDEPTVDPTPDAGPSASPTGEYVCLAYTQAPASGPTLGGGTAQLPFSGAPVGRYAATGLGLVLAGSGTVLLARRRVR